MKRLSRSVRIDQPAVERVTNDWSAKMPRVNADLMCSARMKPTLDEAHRAAAQSPFGQLSEYRARSATAMAPHHRHSYSLNGVAPNGFINLHEIGCNALYEREIATPHAARGNLL